MDFRGYEVNFKEYGTIVHGVRDFDPIHTFECGQCFRWHREPDGSYTGVVRGRVANVSYTPDSSDSTGRLHLNNVFSDDFERIWFDYFDLGRDYGDVKKTIATDAVMEKAVEFGGGIRLLKQEPWETLISFLLSSNNRIPRIKKIIEDISVLYGREIVYKGRRYHSFPDAERLAACSLEQIGACRAGYRCAYIQRAAADLAAGSIDFSKLEELNTENAREYLLRLHGVGNKVADCILLYSGIKYDVFPTDVWVKRVMEELYFKRKAGFEEIRRFASDRFGELAGIAQQYLFYFARENKIGQ